MEKEERFPNIEHNKYLRALRGIIAMLMPGKHKQLPLTQIISVISKKPQQDNYEITCFNPFTAKDVRNVF